MTQRPTTIMSTHLERKVRQPGTGLAPIVATALIVASCGMGPSLIDPDSNLGGDRLPVKAAGEEYGNPTRPLTGRLALGDTGCWTIDLGDVPRLLIFPEGFVKPADNGASMAGPDGTRFLNGMLVDLEGGLVAASTLTDGDEGYWGSYIPYCDPASGEVVIADDLMTAFDPLALDNEALIELFGASQLTRSWGCGFGFTMSSKDQRIVVEMYPTEMAPLPGPVTLPDPNWTAQILIGKHLTANHCDDVVEGWEPEPTIVAIWPITSGTLDFDLPDDVVCGLSGAVEAVLSDAVVETPDGEMAVATIEPVNESFGCFAG